MKKVFALLLALACSFLASGQKDTSWSAQKTEIYGNKAENIYEQTLKSKSESQSLYRFIGFKRVYGAELSAFIQAKMNYVIKSNSYIDKGNDVFILISKEIYKGKIPPKKITVSFAVNEKDNRIISGNITGKFYELSNIFLTYWPRDPAFSGEIPIKQGVAAIKHNSGDLISFIWNGADPSITITKDPNAKTPFPPFTASK